MEAYKWRLYADEDVEKEIVDNLKSGGCDVLWVKEDSNLRNRDDIFHYKKAKNLQRYLITKDSGFWSDRKYTLHHSPGVIIIATQGIDIGSLLVWLVKSLIQDVESNDDPIYLDGVKVKVSKEGITLKYIDRSIQKKSVDSYTWDELGLNLGNYIDV